MIDIGHPFSVRRFNQVFIELELRIELYKNMFELAKLLMRVGLCAPGISDPDLWYVIRHKERNWVFYSGICHLQRVSDSTTVFDSHFGYGYRSFHWPNHTPTGMFCEVLVYAFFIFLGLFIGIDPFVDKPPKNESQIIDLAVIMNTANEE